MTVRLRSISARSLIFALFISSSSAIGSETVSYKYDARGRLVQVNRSGTINNGVNACYAYDKADNRSNVAVSTAAPCSSAPAVSFSVSDIAVKEANDLVFTITKTGTAVGTITLDYATANGGAFSGSDYTASTGSLTFLIGEASKTVSVPTLDDVDIESDENLVLNIFNVSSGAGISDGQGIGTVQDNETDCVGITYTIASNGPVEEGNNSVFTVTKTGSTSSSCSVNYASSNGPNFPQATTPGDYTATSGTLTFASGESSLSVNVPTTEDAEVEGSENLTLNLSSPNRGAALGTPSSAIGSITNDDGCNGVSYTVSSNGAVSEGGNSIFTVTKAGSTNSGCQVSYATSNGTASSPDDYTAALATLFFASNQTSLTVSVATIDDTAAESAETFNITLSNPNLGATLGTLDSASASINDNDSGGACSGVSYSVNDPTTVIEGLPITFTVTKTGSTSSSCTISFSTSNGTAIAPGDYTATFGILTFTPAQLTKTVSVTTIDRNRTLGSKTMFLNLASASDGASISDSQGLGTIQHSEEKEDICITCRESRDPDGGETESAAEPPPDPSQ